MSASFRGVARILKGWASPLILGGIAVVFVVSLVIGVIESGNTAHQLDVSNKTLDRRLAKLPTDAKPQPFPVAGLREIPPNWSIVCYVGTGAWVSKALRKALDNPLTGYKFEPHDIYGVDDYWVFSFVDIEAKTVRSVEVSRDPVHLVQGPICLDRDSAKISSTIDPGLSKHIDLTFVGRPAKLD